MAPLVRSDEADILAVRLGRRAQAEPAGLRPHLGLGHLPHREEGAGQLVLTEHGQHVGLVLQRVRAPAQPEASLRRGHTPGMVAGGHRVEAQGAGPLQQPVELEVPVALDAGVGRPALGMALDVRIDHPLLEFGSEIEDVVDKAQLLSHPPSILHVGHRTAAGIGRATPQFQRRPHDAVAPEPLGEQRRGH